MPEFKLNLSFPVHSPSVFPVWDWRGIYVYFIRICQVLTADQTPLWPYPDFVEENGSITFGMLIVSDLGEQKEKTGISNLFFWRFAF